MSYKIFDKKKVDNTINELVWYINKFHKYWNIEELTPKELYYLLINYPKNEIEDKELIPTLKGTVWEKILNSGVRFKPDTKEEFTKEESPIRFTIGTLSTYGYAAKEVLGDSGLFKEEFGIEPKQFIKFIIEFKKPGKNLLKTELLKKIPEISNEKIKNAINTQTVERLSKSDFTLLMVEILKISSRLEGMENRIMDVQEDVIEIKDEILKIEPIFEKIENIEDFLKEKLSSDWEKIRNSWNAYKTGEINKKEFIEDALKKIGKKFSKIFLKLV